MKYLSVCSGIEAATVAWKPLGWEAVAFSEIEKFPCAVLKHHYPHVPNLGDMTKFKEWPDAKPNVLVGGTPCQSFSVAGLRKGLADPRGNLMLVYFAIAERYRPEWLVWENVPGVLSSGEGRDFGAFLGGLGLIGYGATYRVLDAQYFGLAQRRKRVFVVGHLGDWRRAAAVLFECESLSGNPPPSRKAGEGTAPTISRRASYDRGDGTEPIVPILANPLTARMHKGINTTCDEGQTMIAHSIRAEHDASEDGTGKGTPLVEGSKEGCGCLGVAYPLRSGREIADSNGNGGNVVPAGMSVRRLTPRECERLQGFPDDYTLIHYNGKPAADGPRYKALGNSMAVPVMNWIGHRIEMVASL